MIGFLGAGGQVILFQALRTGPAYLVFPIVSLSPAVAVLLACGFLRERASLCSWVGIVLAMIALPMMSYQSAPRSSTSGSSWLVLALAVFLAWGVQAFYIKLASETMRSESIFFYMMLTAVLLIPAAVAMTDDSRPINWGLDGPFLAAGIQLLNSIGALCLVYAFRYGKAIIVSPLANAGAPVITVLISLVLYRVVPPPIVVAGMVLSILAIVLIAVGPERESRTPTLELISE
jgi:drug/metabolite transporter (DMT)-like permease